jgi:predicted DNA-binding transcriptional regulator YafY
MVPDDGSIGFHVILGRAATMARTQRLLDLIQVLRRHRRAVAGAVLAEEVGISLRTLYRDIETLRAQGASIDGEAGVGYVLRPGFMLPPLMFSEEEIEALVLGSRWVSERADGLLGKAARNVLAKIGAVLPDDLREGIEASGLMIGPGEPIAVGDTELATIRQAIRSGRKLRIAYADEQGSATDRTVWPFVLAFYDRVRVIVAWCELRDGYRHFRTDRIMTLDAMPERYPRRRAMLLKEWRTLRGVPEQ